MKLSKNTLGFFALLLSLTACNYTAQASSQNLQEIHIETNFLKYQPKGIQTWDYIFTVTEDGKGMQQRVHSYESIAALQRDTEKNIKIIASPSPSDDQRFNAKVMQEIQNKVDFSRYNLIVVNMTDAGPPFGKYQYTVKDKLAEFCIKAPSNGTFAGGALRFTKKFYLAPKGMKAKICLYKY